MNFTGGNTLSSIGRRINWQLVSLVGGLAVAVSAAVGLGAFEKDSAPSAPARPAASIGRPAGTTSQATAPRPVMYIVESDEQAASVQTDMAVDQVAAVMAGSEVPYRQTSFLVISTPEEEKTLNETLMEQLLLTEPTLDIVDVRH